MNGYRTTLPDLQSTIDEMEKRPGQITIKCDDCNESWTISCTDERFHPPVSHEAEEIIGEHRAEMDAAANGRDLHDDYTINVYPKPTKWVNTTITVADDTHS